MIEEDKRQMEQDMKIEAKLRKDIDFFTDFYEDQINNARESIQELDRLLKFFGHDDLSSKDLL